MPLGLLDQVANVIEPHTMNAGIDYDEVMTCIEVAFPVIRDHLLAGGRLFSTTYRAMRNGEVWCEDTDPDEVRDAGGDALLKLETYLIGGGWKPWDGT